MPFARLSEVFRPRLIRRLATALALGGALLGGASARAQFINWTGAANSTWTSAKNWNPAKVPTLTSNISLNTNGSRQPVLSGNTGAGYLLYVGGGSTSGAKTSLTIKSAGKLSVLDVAVGFLENAQGAVTVTGTGSTLNATGTFFLGYNGTGSLTVSAGAHVNAVDFSASLNPTAHSAATITGTGSRLTLSANTFIGDAGSGSLLLAAGGNLTSRDSVLGYDASGNGTATVTGNGTQWVTSGNFMVGLVGAGSVNILAGAHGQSQFATLGDIAGSNGTVTVSGPGSRWLNTTSLYIGGYSEGRLTLASGGNVTTNDAMLGYATGAVGEANVSGQGSQWVVANSLVVGQEGTGTISVAQGGKVLVGGVLQLGDSAGGSGTFNLNPGGLLQIGGSNGLHAGTGDYAFNFAGGTLQVISSVLTSSLQANFADNTTSTINTGPYNSFWLGNLAGNGGLSKTGSAALVLSGVNDYSGGTTLAEGVLFLDTSADGYAAGTGSLTTAANTALIGTSHIGGEAWINGQVGPRGDAVAIGLLTFDHDLHLGPTSSLYLELNGTAMAGADYDQIAVLGNLTLNGSLKVSRLYAPSLGDSFQILAVTGTVSGQFSSVSLPALPVGLGWDSSNLYTTGVITVITAPTIFVGPASQVKKGGASATFSVLADGLAPLTYQWYFKGQPITDATSPTLTLTNVTKAANGTYTVTVTNGDGHSVTTTGATLIVDTLAPKITHQPVAVTVASGHAAKFKVTTSGDGPLLYQWRRNNVNLTNGGGLIGATTATLTLAKVKTSSAGTYTCVVTNAAGHAVSKAVKLKVL